jgi:probable addiction module antidote protein
MELLNYDSAEFFRDADARNELLQDALDSNDARYISHAVGVVARAHGMTALAKETGIKRQQLYAAFGKNGNPTIATLTHVLSALGLRLDVVSAQ